MSYLDAFDLSGRVALITGGGTGIGKGCAKMLASAGASVLVVGRREEKLRAVCDEIHNENGVAAFYAADLSREEGCKAAVGACVDKFGRIDILINSAGSRGANGDLDQELSTENYRHTLAADLDSTIFMVKYAYPLCAEHGKGSIINISSLAALGARGPVVYSAAKGAIRSFSRTMAKRLGKQKVRVNTIYPGLIITEMTEGILDRPDLEKHYREESPLGLLGRVEDIAYCALYLASDASAFVTGQDFVIDGGATV